MSDTNNGWPNKDRPGVPLNPERDGWHWLSAMYYDDPIGPPVACFWEAKLERWPRLQDKPGNYPVSRGFCYLSPVATPAEIAAKDARIAELEAILGQLLDAQSPTLEVVKRIGRAALAGGKDVNSG